MDPLALDAATERVAVNFLRHLEWQAEGFSLVFLFAAVGPSLQLADWLDQRLRAEGRPLQRQEARDDFARDPEAQVDALIAQLGERSGQPGALWLGLQRHPGDAQWNLARRKFLARLNERRFLLERDLTRPLVVVLPADFRPEARDIAPDLWHVRALSGELRVPAPPDTGVEPSVVPTPVQTTTGDALPAYLEWQRIQRGSTPESVFLPTSWRACKELLAAGRPGDAEKVALSALSLARGRAASTGDQMAMRSVLLALENVGDVARAQGDWGRAELAYRESLNLARQLVKQLDGTLDALRDLSVSLDRVGGAARAQGDWEQAEMAYRESLNLARQLVERMGGSHDALRDLSVSLDNVGNVARAQGDWEQAEAAYRESLSLRRRLVERLGGTPEALRDLSISLDQVGRVARTQGDWARAETAYRESLDLARQLVERLGGTPEALRDLSISLNHVAGVALDQGDWEQAETAYRESLNLRRHLVECLGGAPEALRDLLVSINNVGSVVRAQGDWEKAETAYRESLSIARQLVEHVGGTPEALRDLSIALDQVGRVARMQGDWEEAETAYRESLNLRRQLVARLDGTPEALDDLAVSLWNVAQIPPGDTTALVEAISISESLATQFPDVAKYSAALDVMRKASASPR